MRCVHLSFEDWLVIPGVGEAALDSGIATDIFGGATGVLRAAAYHGGRGGGTPGKPTDTYKCKVISISCHICLHTQRQT